MKHLKLAAITTSMLIGFILPTTSSAETITTKTVISQQEIKNVNEVDFKEFDTNKDGQYSMQEVGEKLFTVFDQNNDTYVDNLEWDEKNMMTIIPMEAEVIQYIDTDNDKVAEATTYSYTEFYKRSGLMKFDDNKDGLSAEEFIGEGFEALDIDENKMIDMEEWKKAYVKSEKYPNANQKQYNDGL